MTDITREAVEGRVAALRRVPGYLHPYMDGSCKMPGEMVASVIDDMLALLARAETAERERDFARKNFNDYLLSGYEMQKTACSRYGLEPGQLQFQWRQGLRTDREELEWAIVDALAMGGIPSHPGDGVGCAAQIVTAQMNKVDALTAERDRLAGELARWQEDHESQTARAMCAEEQERICAHDLAAARKTIAGMREALENINPLVVGTMEGYLRVCASGGMPRKDRELVLSQVQRAADLDYFRAALAQANKTGEPGHE